MKTSDWAWKIICVRPQKLNLFLKTTPQTPFTRMTSKTFKRFCQKTNHKGYSVVQKRLGDVKKKCWGKTYDIQGS